MEIQDPGHSYLVDMYDAHPDVGDIVDNITFMKRNEPSEKYPGNTTHYPGTNCQEVIRVLIDRIEYLEKQKHSSFNWDILVNLNHSLYLLEKRNAYNKGFNLEEKLREKYGETVMLECHTYDTCRTCGHWFCEEH